MLPPSPLNHCGNIHQLCAPDPQPPSSRFLRGSVGGGGQEEKAGRAQLRFLGLQEEEDAEQADSCSPLEEGDWRGQGDRGLGS